ncbi:MAG: hypothetical protein K6F85_02865 [Bacteroidales bacterium]|nr:hypothetical protein [Bacteroidales bacterium]
MEERKTIKQETQNPEETLFFTVKKTVEDVKAETNMHTEVVDTPPEPIPQKEKEDIERPQPLPSPYGWTLFIVAFVLYLLFATAVQLTSDVFGVKRLFQDAMSAVVFAVVLVLVMDFIWKHKR